MPASCTWPNSSTPCAPGSRPGCLIEDAHASTAAVKLAMIAYDTGCRIAWDAQQQQIPGNPAAAKLLQREYRTPWKHPSVA